MTEPAKSIEFEALLDYLRHNRGFDFTGYKRASLMRRVNRRMQMVGIEGYNNYLDYLEVHPEEFSSLFNTLLINVTSFFRDPLAWEHIQTEIVPRILNNRDSGLPIRVWSAGCASGQEAYTIAIVLAEALGSDQFRARVKIYATDVDDEALNQARLATYHERELAGLSPEQIEQFFERTNDNRYTFRKDLRRAVIFGRHDLLQDAPISKIDLLVCRNTLMYFNAETQSRILSRFHFALADGGFLFLGKAEMLLTHTNIFIPAQLKYRIFNRVAKLNLRDQLLIMAQTGNNEEAVNHLSAHARLRDAALDSCLLASFVVDVNSFLTLANERARNLLNLLPQDLGRPIQDLEISYRPVELRSCIEKAYIDRQAVYVRDVAWQTVNGEVVYLDVQVAPLLDASQQILGAVVNFTDVTRSKRLQEELEHSKQELEMAYEELQSTNEELETTNEELQSSNEELETTNEELQSTNEELETMNEELQSTNEELQTVNEELQRRSDDLNQINAFLESILTSLKGGVVVVDRNLRVQVWNHKTEDLWGLRSEEAMEQNFLNFDIGLPVEQLRQPMRDCLTGPGSTSEVVLSATNRRGKKIQCRVTCTPLATSQGHIQGIILIMEEHNQEEAGGSA